MRKFLSNGIGSFLSEVYDSAAQGDWGAGVSTFLRKVRFEVVIVKNGTAFQGNRKLSDNLENIVEIGDYGFYSGSPVCNV